METLMMCLSEMYTTEMIIYTYQCSQNNTQAVEHPLLLPVQEKATEGFYEALPVQAENTP